MSAAQLSDLLALATVSLNQDSVTPIRSYRPSKLRNRRYPIKIAFVMTISFAQGQALKRVREHPPSSDAESCPCTSTILRRWNVSVYIHHPQTLKRVRVHPSSSDAESCPCTSTILRRWNVSVYIHHPQALKRVRVHPPFPVVFPIARSMWQLPEFFHLITSLLW